RTLLRKEQGQEKGLEEQVAELVQELRRVARECGIRHLVGLLDRVRHDRPRRLDAIPRAIAAEPLRECLEIEERLGEAQPTFVVGTLRVACGLKPLAYEVLVSYSFLTSSNHFVSSAFFFCWSSCWRIGSVTSLSGVVLLSVTAVSAWMMCQPNCVLT